jgi:hypothetical protein
MKPTKLPLPRQTRKDIARRTRVVKTLQPGARGTLKLAAAYGERLVCVRYRHEPGTVARYTTVEIVVDEGRARVQPRAGRLYGIETRWGEDTLVQQLRDAGAAWDAGSELWRVDGAAVLRLGLGRRVRAR